MTPTVARMVAGREHDLTFPLRWFSIPNLFRYEKPQRGRLREHWQLNVDLFGVDSVDADVEIISVAHAIMREFGANEEHFVVKMNSRKLMQDLYAHFKLTDDQSYKLSKIIDKKNKIPSDVFSTSVMEIMSDAGASQQFVDLLASNERLLDTLGAENENSQALVALIEKLAKSGIKNVEFDPTLMRGFDYYTGVVFEVFDTDPENPRSVFGGGRYDDLLDIFDARKVPAVGFGAGDVTMRDFLDTHKLLPTYKPTTDVYICTLNAEFSEHARELADTLRTSKLNIALDLSGKKIGDQIKIANKQSVPYILVVGSDEVASGVYPLKNLATGEEKKVKVEEVVGVVRG
jgi:histidyl-tRNA synthetase